MNRFGIEPTCCELEFDQACVDKVSTVCGLVCEYRAASGRKRLNMRVGYELPLHGGKQPFIWREFP
jgi:hypothetical protein